MADFFVVDVEDLPPVLPQPEGNARAPNSSQSTECESSWARVQAESSHDYSMASIPVAEPIVLKGAGGSTLYVATNCHLVLLLLIVTLTPAHMDIGLDSKRNPRDNT